MSIEANRIGLLAPSLVSEQSDGIDAPSRFADGGERASARKRMIL
jgi:hypothetical protein